VEAFGGLGLVYRVGQHEFASDYYNEWFVPPAVQVRELVGRWLARAGIRVVHVPAAAAPSQAGSLYLEVISWFGDYSDQATAVVEVRVLALRSEAGDPRTLLEKTYRQDQVLADDRPETLVNGLADALTRLLAELDGDLLPVL
jgi:hypothetical protein